MNDRTKSDLLFDEDEELMDALEEAVDKLSKNEYWTKDKQKTDDEEKEDLPLLIF